MDVGTVHRRCERVAASDASPHLVTQVRVLQLTAPGRVADQAVALPAAGAARTEVAGDAAGATGTGAALNPLAISHTPMNSSHRPPGRTGIKPRLNPSSSNTAPPR